MGVFTARDKVTGMRGAAGLIGHGSVVAVGGALSLRQPMALIREMARQGIKGLHVAGTAHGVDVDMLCGAGCVETCEESYVGFEQDFGMAPNFRRACEAGKIRVKETCCYTIIQQLRAAEMGLPFLPVRSVKGTDMLKLHPEYRRMTCPYTGEELVLVPALRPDFAIIHAQYGDCLGNLKILAPRALDLEFARASRRVIATVEKLVSKDEMRRMEPDVARFYVEAVVEAPYGAHPTSCYPFYAYDRRHMQEYAGAAGQGPDHFRNYLDKYVYGAPEPADYLALVGGGRRMKELSSWQRGTEDWKALYE